MGDGQVLPNGTTVAIIDLAHSGTTMLAGICEIFGVPMVVGAHHEKLKWEDRDVIVAVNQGEEAFAALVKERNAQLSCWGFKMPGVWQHAPMLKTHLRNPVYLVIYKDPVSVTRRRFIKGETQSLNKVRNTVCQCKESLDGILASQLPVHIFSYHKAIITPVAFVQQVATAIGFSGVTDRAVEYIQPNRAGARAHYPEVEPWI